MVVKRKKSSVRGNTSNAKRRKEISPPYRLPPGNPDEEEVFSVHSLQDSSPEPEKGLSVKAGVSSHNDPEVDSLSAVTISDDSPNTLVDAGEDVNLDLEEVNVSPNHLQHSHDSNIDTEEENFDLEEVEIGAEDDNIPDRSAYASVYEAAQRNDGDDEPTLPVFKDGKGQPGNISISLSAMSSADKSEKPKKTPTITTRDRQVRLATHKWMVLSIISHSRHRNELINDERLRDDLFSLVPNSFLEKLRKIHPKRTPSQNERIRQFEAFLRELTKWWSYKFRLDPLFTTLGALRQPDDDLLSGSFPKPGTRVDGWIAESPRERQSQLRQGHHQWSKRQRLNRAQAGGKLSSPSSTKPPQRAPFPRITLFGPGQSTTPLYLHLADLQDPVRTADDLIERVHVMNGSRETSAQLFTSLCRALGIPARLIVSIQAPSWSISASKVANTIGIRNTKEGVLTSRRKAHHEKSKARQELQRVEKDEEVMTSDEEIFTNDDDFLEQPDIRSKKLKRSIYPPPDGSASRKSSVESESTIRHAVPLSETNEGHSKQISSFPLTLRNKRDSDYRSEKWRGLEKPLEVEYKPKLRSQKAKSLKPSEMGVDTVPDIAPVDTLAPPTVWTEVYSKPWQRWVTVDPIRGLVEPTGNRQMEPSSNDKSNRLVYVVAFEEDGYARDVTARYTRTLHSRVSRMRPPLAKRGGSLGGSDWWDRVVAAIHRPQKLDRDAVEDLELEGAAAREPMPTSVAAFKDHPVYALEKHIKRDEVIHPLKQAGTFQGFPVFLRSHVISCKSARQWYNEGRVVKVGEEALKWVKSRGYTLHNKRAEEEARQQGLDGLQEGLYGFFQTELYQPPPVVDGKVPTNSFGNIDLFVKSMLPPGAAHIPYNGAAKVAKQLGIHYADAITGFEFRKNRSMPKISGIVVADEHCGTIIDSFWVSEHLSAEKELRRRQERLFKNWKKLLNALKIQERLQREYMSKSKDVDQGNGSHMYQDFHSHLEAESEDAGGFVVE